MRSALSTKVLPITPGDQAKCAFASCVVGLDESRSCQCALRSETPMVVAAGCVQKRSEAPKIHRANRRIRGVLSPPRDPLGCRTAQLGGQLLESAVLC